MERRERKEAGGVKGRKSVLQNRKEGREDRGRERKYTGGEGEGKGKRKHHKWHFFFRTLSPDINLTVKIQYNTERDTLATEADS